MSQENYRPTPEKQNKKPNFTLRRIGAITFIALALSGGFEGFKGIEHLNNYPKFSTGTTEWTAGSSQGLDNAAAHVNGVSKVDIREVADYIANMPENKKALSNGLQLGEEIDIPKSVSP